MLYIQSLVIPSYAKHWKKIGTELQLDDSELDNIEANYATHSEKVEKCCRAVIIQWLRVDPTATWTKLFNAIDAIITYPDPVAG